MKVTNLTPVFNAPEIDPVRVILVDTTDALLHPGLCTTVQSLDPEETRALVVQVDTQGRQDSPLPTECKVFGHVYCHSRESQGETEETVQLPVKVEKGESLKREKDRDLIVLRITNPTRDKYICAYTIVA